MLLFTAILFIAFEAIAEGLAKRFNFADDFLFDAWVQWVIALLLFGVWFIVSIHFDGYFVPVWKIVTGFVFIRFAIFDVLWNLSRGVEWNYYGVTKLYDKIMTVLGSWGWMVKAIAAVWGISWLLGWQDGIKRAR
jgi:hypothetical protein